ncbi:hypothetical protein SteCoe_19431 [Stentor coeruleus]|uniref:RING-type E3 ubiquitin transferase n=1 Tax=Stentor coeruleus TaxID=5963 RepID=A0A1R2BU41_9CILI|nr:hypothetical protein SteCoe_19431 [Stentor coeruleus]
MAEKNIPVELKQSFDCTICFEKYNIKRLPCTLSCGHTFCFQCIMKLISSNFTLLCPMDKKTLKIQVISGNLSFMNLINKIKSFYKGKPYIPIKSNFTKFAKNCRNFAKSMICKYGEKCKFFHKDKEPNSSYTDSYSESYDYEYDDSDYDDEFDDYEYDEPLYDDSDDDDEYHGDDDNILYAGVYNNNIMWDDDSDSYGGSYYNDIYDSDDN